MIVHFSFGSLVDSGTYIHVTDCNVSIIDSTPIWHAGWYTGTYIYTNSVLYLRCRYSISIVLE